MLPRFAPSGAYVPPTALTPPMFAGDGLELFDVVLRMDGLDGFHVEWASAVAVVLADVPSIVR